jgi:hypothetical protein
LHGGKRLARLRARGAGVADKPLVTPLRSSLG